MARTLFRITYSDNGEKQALVVAETAPEAAAFLGLSQWQSGAEIAKPVEVAGLDKPHAAVIPKPPDIMPPAPEGLTTDDIRKLKELLAKTK